MRAPQQSKNTGSVTLCPASADAAVLSFTSYLEVPRSMSFENRSALKTTEAKSHSLSRFYVSHLSVYRSITPARRP